MGATSNVHRLLLVKLFSNSLYWSFGFWILYGTLRHNVLGCGECVVYLPLWIEHTELIETTQVTEHRPTTTVNEGLTHGPWYA